MVRFAHHGTNEVCGVECKSAVFYGTELSNPQSSSIGELYRGNILEGISLPQAASRFSSRNSQIEKNQFQMLNFICIIFNITSGFRIQDFGRLGQYKRCLIDTYGSTKRLH